MFRLPHDGSGGSTPALVTLPEMVPPPVSHALEETLSPLAKEWIPPFKLNCAQLVPLPMAKGCALFTVEFRALRRPPLNLNPLELPLVRNSRSASTRPLNRFSVPRRTSRFPS